MRTVYAYIDIDHLAAAWGAYRGVLVSAHAESISDGCPVSMMMAGLVSSQNAARLQNEIHIELVRQKNFPMLPSRLSAMYFFESETDAKQVGNWGGHFVPKNLVELELYPTAEPSRHDSNWITYAELTPKGTLASLDWIHSYWRSEPFDSRAPVWELLAQGRAVVCGTSLRERAYNIVKSRQPLTVSILEVSRLAAHAGSDLGQTKAFLVSNPDGTTSINYYLDMRDAENPALLARLAQHDGPKNFKDLAVGGDKFQVPDFREYSSTLNIDLPITEAFVAGVHDTRRPNSNVLRIKKIQRQRYPYPARIASSQSFQTGSKPRRVSMAAISLGVR